MRGLNRQMRCALAVCVLLTPRVAQAQMVTTSFDQLRRVLNTGQTVIVTEATGQRTKGKVADVSSSPPSVMILVPQPRTFPESAVAEIRAVDSLRNGALIGSSVGLGLAVWDYLIDPSEPGNAAIFAVSIGFGVAIGMGVDALIKGKVLYRSPRHKRGVTISPIAGRDRRGVLLSVRF